jgi:hypothetical protein
LKICCKGFEGDALTGGQKFDVSPENSEDLIGGRVIHLKRHRQG